MFDISGTIKKIFDEQTFGSGFNKREFVITTSADRYPQDIKFELVKDKVSLLEPLKEGDKIKVFFDIRGREWKENYYVNLNAWKIEGEGSGTPAPEDGPPLREPEMGAGEIDEEPPF
jgi:single-strand DNA-binding protein